MIKNPYQTGGLQGPKSQFSALVKVWSHQVLFMSPVSNPGPKSLGFRRILDHSIQTLCMMNVSLQ